MPHPLVRTFVLLNVSQYGKESKEGISIEHDRDMWRDNKVVILSSTARNAGVSRTSLVEENASTDVCGLKNTVRFSAASSVRGRYCFPLCAAGTQPGSSNCSFWR
jgi:hypothetical protein